MSNYFDKGLLSVEVIKSKIAHLYVTASGYIVSVINMISFDLKLVENL